MLFEEEAGLKDGRGARKASRKQIFSVKVKCNDVVSDSWWILPWQITATDNLKKILLKTTEMMTITVALNELLAS